MRIWDFGWAWAFFLVRGFDDGCSDFCYVCALFRALVFALLSNAMHGWRRKRHGDCVDAVYPVAFDRSKWRGDSVSGFLVLRYEEKKCL